MLEKLKDAFSDKTLKILTWAAFIVFIVLTVIFQFQNFDLTNATGYGIIEFEFVFNETTANTILAAWGSSWIPLVLLGTYIDFGYIIAYGLLIMGLAILIVRKLEDKFQTFGMVIALTGFIAGIFDVIENINLIMMLNNPAGYPGFAPLLASVCATIKFGFLFLAIGFALVATIIILMRKRKSD